MNLTRMYISSRYWRFGRADGSVIANKIRLRRDGIIEGYSHPNEARWRLEKGILFFCREDGVVTTRFGIQRPEPGTAVLSGPFLFDEKITHVLTETGSVTFAKREELPWILPVRPNLGQPLFISPQDLQSFEITFAGTSVTPPHPDDLFRMFQAPSTSQPARITLSLGQRGASIVTINPKEMINIVVYSQNDDHNPPRSAREHQYRAGFRWEARILFGLDRDNVDRLAADGWPRLFDIIWWHRNKPLQVLPHAVYILDLQEKTEFSFLHITDTHIAVRNDLIPEVLAETRERSEWRQLQLRYHNFNDNLRAVIRFANKEKVDFIVITGDLVDFYHDGVLTKADGSAYYQDYEAGERGERGGWLGRPPQETSNLRKFVDIITGRDGRSEALQCPIFTVLGNHDYLLMEYPISMNATAIGFSIKQVRKPDAWGLSDQEANEFEFWKRQKGDSLAKRIERRRPGKSFDRPGCEQGRCILYGTPEFEAVNYSQYLTEICYDTDFIVRLGKHRLICLNTGEDVGIPDLDHLLMNELNLYNIPTAEKHYLDDQSHNRGILPSHYEMINEASREAISNDGLACLFTHAPLVRERSPGDFDSSSVQWNLGVSISGDTFCLNHHNEENANAIQGMDGAIAEWNSQIPIPMVKWLQTGAGGLHAIFSGHSHDVREYRMGNGVQVCKGDYSVDLGTASNKTEWLNQHSPLQFISGALKSSKCSFRHVVIKDNYLRSASMRDILDYYQEDNQQLPFLFTAKSIKLARFGGYASAARNDLNPAVHIVWARAVRHNLMMMWDLMEKYYLQLGNVEYLEAVLQTEGRSSMSSALLEKLQRVEETIEEEIPIYARIIGKYPSTDWWYNPQDPGLPYGRRRNQFYALCVVSLNEFGLDFGSSEKNSLDLEVHYDWARRKNTMRLQDALEERIGKLFEFGRGGPVNLLAMWFAAESIHLAPWSSWGNPARDNREPAFHLRWALGQNREGILRDLREKYEIAARYQYQSRQEAGLKEFYIYHSMRMAAWGASAETLDEQPDAFYFEAQSARLKAVVENEAAWVEAIIRDLQERVRRTGYPLGTFGS